jgi:hypothetical protein
MSRTLIFVLILTFMTIGAATAQETKTIKGEVVDVSCYVAEGAKGEDHETCALACLQAGEPAGILEEGTGKVYVVITMDHSNPATKVIPYVAKMVEVKGSVSERGGISTIDIKEIKKLEEAAPTKTETGAMKEKQKTSGY